jgi:hypothetical protein
MSYYARLQQKKDPNMYVLEVQPEIEAYINPTSNGVMVSFVASMNQEVSIAEIEFLNHKVFLTRVESGLWWASAILPKIQSGSVLLRTSLNQVMYLSGYYLEYKPSSKFVSLRQQESALDSFSVFPKGYSDTVDQPYIPPTQDYGRENLLQGQLFGVTSNLDVRGVKTVSIRNKRTRGNAEISDSEGMSRDELLLLNITGQVGPAKVAATIQDSSVELDDTNPNSVEVYTDRWSLYFGEYVSAINSTDLAAFNKRLDGMKVKYENAPLKVQFMMSESKGSSGYDEIYGLNSQGPYFLSQTPVVVNSETVVLNGKTLVRDSDYTIDYELGEITFKTDIVEDSELFTVSYEYSNTLYKRKFTALDAEYKSTDNKRIYSASLQNISDAKTVVVGDVSPTDHWVFGSRVKMPLSTTLMIDQEVAYSFLDSNSLESGGESQDIAIKESVRYKTDAVDAGLKIKKIGGQYQPLGDASMVPGLWVYEIDYSEEFQTQNAEVSAEHSREVFTENNELVEEEIVDFSIRYKESDYKYFQRQDADRSSVSQEFDRLLSRHTVSHSFRYGQFRFKPELDLELQKDVFDNTYNARNESFRFSGSLIGVENVNLSFFSEFETEYVDVGEGAYRRTIGFSSAIDPSRALSLEGTAQLIHDSQDGISALSTLSYFYKLNRKYSTSGHYDLETVNEFYTDTTYRVMKHDGNFKFNAKVLPSLKFKYRFKPSLTTISDLSYLELDRRIVHQFNLDSNPLESLSLGVAYKLTNRLEKDISSLPMNIIKRKQREDTVLFQSHYMVTKKQNINYSLDITKDTETSLLTSSSSSNSNYDLRKQLNQLHNVVYSNQLLKSLRLRLEYGLESNRVTSQVETSSNLWQETQTYRLASDWDVSSRFSTSITGAVTDTHFKQGEGTDSLLISPRLDIVYRPLPKWQWDASYELTKSVSGENQRKNNVVLRTRYDMNVLKVADFNVSAQLSLDETIVPEFQQVWEASMQMNILF